MGVFTAKYLADRIIQLAIKYSDVVKKYPNEKEKIDAILIERNMQHLMDAEDK